MQEEKIADGSVESNPVADEPLEGTVEAAPMATKGPRGLSVRIMVYGVFSLVVLLIGMDVLARRSHGQSITALERVFRQKPGSLKLSEAQRSVSGFWSMKIRSDQSGTDGSKSRFAVFRWWCLFGDYWLEVGLGDGEDPLVLTEPYVAFKKTYEVLQPEAKSDPLPLQIMMLDHEEDSVGSNRVERFQVERAIKENRAKQDLLDYFDRVDVDGDGVVTAGEVAQDERAEGRSPDGP